MNGMPPVPDPYTCGQCGRSCSGAPFSVIGSRSAVGGGGEEHTPLFLCSQQCRDAFMLAHLGFVPDNPDSH